MIEFKKKHKLKYNKKNTLKINVTSNDTLKANFKKSKQFFLNFRKKRLNVVEFITKNGFLLKNDLYSCKKAQFISPSYLIQSFNRLINIIDLHYRLSKGHLCIFVLVKNKGQKFLTDYILSKLHLDVDIRIISKLREARVEKLKRKLLITFDENNAFDFNLFYKEILKAKIYVAFNAHISKIKNTFGTYLLPCNFDTSLKTVFLFFLVIKSFKKSIKKIYKKRKKVKNIIKSMRRKKLRKLIKKLRRNFIRKSKKNPYFSRVTKDKYLKNKNKHKKKYAFVKKI